MRENESGSDQQKSDEHEKGTVTSAEPQGDDVDLSEVNSLETEEADEIRSIVQSAMYAGPLPPPQMLHQYEAVLPGMADRIMSMAEKEQAIRSRDNGWLVFNDFARVFGSVVVSLGLVGGAIYCAVIGQPAVAIAFAASGLVPQIVKYFNGKKDT
ncbi:DUF2335 domain-containing protein [Roseibaca calidilacus]|uniref:Uncharacterized membrane protein n=1 Tax=Roseibaca calidilacus TaxID=1666912 RepID=A0ABM9VVW7_9RHOB|nr:DUF2335 domain-containing protein [Roseibaca calidilacus]CUX82854.1 Uncharacterized membrane protein [Roseibaca calidilacus]